MAAFLRAAIIVRPRELLALDPEQCRQLIDGASRKLRWCRIGDLTERPSMTNAIWDWLTCSRTVRHGPFRNREAGKESIGEAEIEQHALGLDACHRFARQVDDK